MCGESDVDDDAPTAGLYRPADVFLNYSHVWRYFLRLCVESCLEFDLLECFLRR